MLVPLLLGTSFALAVAPGERAQQILSDAEAPPFLLVCSPVGSLVDALAPFVALAPPMDLPENVAPFVQLLAPGAAEAWGLDLSGELLADPRGLRLPWAATPDQARAFLASMGEVSGDAPPWVLGPAGGSVADLVDGALVITDVSKTPSGGAGTFPIDLLEGLGGEQACVMGARAEKEGPITAMAAGVDLAGGPTVVRLQPRNPPPEILSSATTEVPEIRTQSPPLGVVVLAVDPLRLATDPALANLARKLDLADLDPEVVRFPEGVVIGFYGPVNQPNVAAAISSVRPNGRPVPVRWLRRGVKALGDDARFTSRTRFTANAGDMVFHGLIERGRLLLSTDPEVLEEMRADEGTPWVDEELAAWTRQWPLSVWAEVPDMMTHQGSTPVRLGIRTDGPAWEVTLDVGAGSVMAVGLMAAVAVPAAIKAFRDEVGEPGPGMLPPEAP